MCQIFLAVETNRSDSLANRISLCYFLKDAGFSVDYAPFGRVRVTLKKSSEETKLWMTLSKFHGKVYQSGL